MPTGNVLTGARARFTLGGKQVGYATGVTVREMIQYEPIKTLDNIQTVEHAPTDYEVSMTAELVRIIGTTIKSEGWFPEQGTSPSGFLSNVLSSGELTATIEADANIGSPTIVMNVEGVRISERNMNISARGVVGTNVTMVAIRARDESDI